MDAVGFFFHTEPLSGAANMAVDAWLLEEAARRGCSLLRVYAWLRPTLSLGYFQRLEEVAAAPVEWVRRMTGGGAILHHREITLSLALPLAHAWAQGSVEDSYRAFAAPLRDLLRRLGVAAEFRGAGHPVKRAHCFAGASSTDLLVEGRKVFGSAQRRRAGALLTHGSLLLEVERPLWRRVFGARLGEGFAGVGLEGEPWAELVRESYACALGGRLWEDQKIADVARFSAYSGDSGQLRDLVLS